MRRSIPSSLSLKRTAAALAGLVASLRAFDFGLPEKLTDHTPVNYAARLEAVRVGAQVGHQMQRLESTANPFRISIAPVKDDACS